MSNEVLNNAVSNLPVRGFLKIDELIIPQGDELVQAILDLKKEKNAVILAHYYNHLLFRTLLIIWEIHFSWHVQRKIQMPI